MRRGRARLVLLSGALLCAAPPARAGTYVPPPALPVPDAWQGRAEGVIRVLDKLDAHVETLTLKAGDTGHYKSLAVVLRSCMDRPDGMPHDSAAFLDVQDQHGDSQPFSGWSFAREPAIGVFESPVYAVQLVACQGALVAPLAPPLPAPPPPPPEMVRSTPDPGQPGADSGAASDAAGGAAVDPGDQVDAEMQGTAAAPPPPSPSPSPSRQAPQPAAPPDAVYPDGNPPPAQPPQR